MRKEFLIELKYIKLFRFFKLFLHEFIGLVFSIYAYKTNSYLFWALATFFMGGGLAEFDIGKEKEKELKTQREKRDA